MTVTDMATAEIWRQASHLKLPTSHLTQAQGIGLNLWAVQPYALHATVAQLVCSHG